MSPEQLHEHVKRLREEIDREREERNFFQLERDKINGFWEITKKQLSEVKATLQVKEHELEDKEEKHQVEIKVYKQKVKHLLYEHQNNITELKQEGRSHTCSELALYCTVNMYTYVPIVHLYQVPTYNRAVLGPKM